jgi:DNA-directed RNA polymerase specialized sigma24 family protein
MADELERLRADAVAGDEGAWRTLFERLHPGVERRVRGSRSFAGFRRSEDDVREVVTAVFERLRRDRHRALRLCQEWLGRHADKTFDDWLSIVTTNVLRDYVSARLGAGEPTFDAGIAADDLEPAAVGRRRMGSATLTSARQLGAVAKAKLSPDQLAVLDDWLQGFDFDEVAARHGVPDGRAAERIVRAALARVRRHVDA